MVSLGFMAKGYRMREDQVRQEEAQKSAMDFQREQFEFKKSAHADTIASAKEKILATKKTKQDTNFFKAIVELTGSKANPKNPVNFQAYPEDTIARLKSSGLFDQKVGLDGSPQFFPDRSTAAYSAFILKNITSVQDGTLNPEELSAADLKSIISKDKAFNGENSDDIKKKYINKHILTNRQKSVKEVSEARTSYANVDKTDIISILSPQGKTITHLPSRFRKYSHLGPDAAKNLSLRAVADVQLWNNYLEKEYVKGSSNSPSSLYAQILKATPKHILNKFENFGKKGTDTFLEGSTQISIDQAQFKHLSRNFPHLVNKDSQIQKIQKQFGVSPKVVAAAQKEGAIELNSATVPITAKFNPERKSGDNSEQPSNENITFFKVDRARLQELKKQMSGNGDTSNDVTPDIVSSDNGEVLRSPVAANTDTEKSFLAGTVLWQMAARNPEGVFQTPEFKQFSSNPKNQGFTQDELLKNIQLKYKPLTDSLRTYARTDSKENLLRTVQVYKEQDAYKEKTENELIDIILGHRKNVVVDSFKATPKTVVVDGARQAAGISIPVTRRRGKDLTDNERASQKANDSSLLKIDKLTPMLTDYKKARSTINLLQAYQNGEITNVGMKQVIQQYASSPFLLEELKKKDKATYTQLMKIADSGTYDANLFGAVDRTLQTVNNLVGLKNYISNALSSSNLSNSVKLFTKDIGAMSLADINKVPNNENKKGWDTKVGRHLNDLQGLIDKEQKAVQRTLADESLTSIGRAQAIARGEMLMLRTSMTYYYAGLVQGESGGRAISNEDFQNIYNALWSGGVGGHLAKGALIQLEATLSGIKRRAEALKDGIGYGPQGDTKFTDMLVNHERNAEEIRKQRMFEAEDRITANLTSPAFRRRGLPSFITLRKAASLAESRKGTGIYNKITSKSKTNLVEVLKVNNLEPKKFNSYNPDQQKSIRKALLSGLMSGPYNMNTENMMSSEGIPANNVTMFNDLSKSRNLGDLFNKAIKKSATSEESRIVMNALEDMFDHMITKGT